MIGIKKHMTKIKKPSTIKLNTIKSPQLKLKSQAQ